MTQENKELLLKELCSSLPYFTKAQINNEIVVLDSICDSDGYRFNFIGDDIEGVNIENIKPYLFPLSSMTEEQKKELFTLCDFYKYENEEGRTTEVLGIEIASRPDPAYCYDHTFRIWGIDMRAINWLLKNHFDIYGLIPMGLAIDATGLNIY